MNATSVGNALRGGDLNANLVGFVHLLRQNGFPVAPADTLSALAVLAELDIADREEFYIGLHTVLVRDHEREAIFRDLFEHYWRASPFLVSKNSSDPDSSGAVEPIEPKPQGSAGHVEASDLVQRYSSEIELSQLRQVTQACVEVARQLSSRPSRRYERDRHGSRVILRDTLRQSLQRGGLIVELSRMRRKTRKPDIVLVCDVSRSMDRYSAFVLEVIHSMQNLRGRVESFVFSTSLFRVTPYFRRASLATAIQHISDDVPSWGGGTRIGDSFRRLNRDFGGTIDRHTAVLILSDGIDTSRPDVLVSQMRALQKRSRSIVWLNPIESAGQSGEIAESMRTILPFIDIYATGKDAATLTALARRLKRRGSVRAS